MSDEDTARQTSAQMLIPITQAAALLMVTERWIRDLQKKGYIPTAERAKVSLVGAVQGYIKWLKDEERRSSKSASASRLQDAKTREVELRNAREESRLIDFEDVEAVVADILATYRDEMRGVPAASTRDLKLRAIIEKQVNGAFDRCRARFEKAQQALRSGGQIELVGEEAES